MQRCGIGYDVHRFAEGRPLILGGVEIPHDRGLIGHSDADALCHAIADAILGAMGDHDIGFYFPPGDEQWEGVSSLVILQEVRKLAEKKSAWIHNIDSTVIAEAPKIMPHAEAMKQAIAGALGFDNVTGVLAPGADADIIVLDRNIFDVPAGDVGETNVLLTLFEGEPVYASGAYSSLVSAAK